MWQLNMELKKWIHVAVELIIDILRCQLGVISKEWGDNGCWWMSVET